MRKHIYVVIFSLLIISCKQSNNLEANKNTSKVNLTFQQNNKTITPENGVITLDKEAFKLVFNYTEPQNILINASFNNNLMFKALTKDTLVTQPQFTLENIIAEPYFNPDKMIYASSQNSSAWLQERMENHMFNSLKKDNKTYTGTRIVENIFNQDTNKNIKIKNIKEQLYLVFVVVATNNNLKSNIELQRIAVKVEWKENNNNNEAIQEQTTFKSVINKLTSKTQPLVEDTNFDSIIEQPYFFNTQEVAMLQLEKIYPNYYKEGFNYRTTPSYKIEFFKTFYSVVFTSYIGDHEMESILANYELDGLLIDYKVISYDEIAENVIRITSKIEDKKITKTTTKTLPGDKEITIEHFILNDTGFIHKNEFINTVLEQLNINETEILTNIEVNYNPYKIFENSETIGITVYYEGSSRVNPYNSEEFTLLNRSGAVLKPVLKDYKTHNLTGENDGNGTGFYNVSSKSINIEETPETEFYNLKITDSIKEVSFKNRSDKKINSTVNQELLIYQNGTYKLNTTN